MITCISSQEYKGIYINYVGLNEEIKIYTISKISNNQQNKSLKHSLLRLSIVDKD